MDRLLLPYLRQDLKTKIIVLSGPRQSGKTTLAKMIDPDHEYVNYDSVEHRTILLERSWDRHRRLLILDELHKMKRWKAWLKGIYDTEGLNPSIVVTGSARLETHRKVGDSMAGRYFPFRLHPLDVKEVCSVLPGQEPGKVLEDLLRVGGFPEPFLKGTEGFYNRWRRTHLDIILRQDLIELETVRDILQIETLIELLRTRVGSPVSYASLARDLSCSDKTVRSWLTVLENMYVVFRVAPYHRNIARALHKAPKYYFYDVGQVKGDLGAKLENLVACALLKEIHFRIDCLGEPLTLNYLRTKDGLEVDFVLTRDDEPVLLMEVKWSDDQPSAPLRSYVERLRKPLGIQLVGQLKRAKTFPFGVEVRGAAQWLQRMAW